MADIANKYAENVSGKFYVDDQCIEAKARPQREVRKRDQN